MSEFLSSLFGSEDFAGTLGDWGRLVVASGFGASDIFALQFREFRLLPVIGVIANKFCKVFL